jgi:hypothetical protein
VLAYCAREEIALSDAVVRRAMRFEIAREKQRFSLGERCRRASEKVLRRGEGDFRSVK